MYFLTASKRTLHFIFNSERRVRPVLLSVSWARQLSRDVPENAGLLCDKAAVLDAALKQRSRITKLSTAYFKKLVVYLFTHVDLSSGY